MATDKESVLARIRALAAKTTAAGCTEAEAKAAAELVDTLLEKYELTLDDIAIRQNAEVEMIEIEKLARHAVRFAAREIAVFTDIKFWTHDNRDLVYLGLEVDIAIAEYLTTLFWRAIDRESGTYTLLNPEYAMARHSEQSEMRWAFEVGMAVRLGERLKALKSKRDFTLQAAGKSLMIVKQPIINDAFATLGIVLHPGSRGRSVTHGRAYNAGRDAGDRVNIHQGVAGRANNNGRIT